MGIAMLTLDHEGGIKISRYACVLGVFQAEPRTLNFLLLLEPRHAFVLLHIDLLGPYSLIRTVKRW